MLEGLCKITATKTSCIRKRQWLTSTQSPAPEVSVTQALGLHRMVNCIGLKSSANVANMVSWQAPDQETGGVLSACLQLEPFPHS